MIQYLRRLVPKTIEGRVVGARNLKYWVLGPSGDLCDGARTSAAHGPGAAFLRRKHGEVPEMRCCYLKNTRLLSNLLEKVYTFSGLIVI